MVVFNDQLVSLPVEGRAMIIVLLAVEELDVSNRGFVMCVGNRLNKDRNKNGSNDSCNDCVIKNDNDCVVARNSAITRGTHFSLP